MSNEKISIQELVDQIAQQAGTTKKKAEDFLRIFQSTIEDALIKDGLVKIKGFGTFKLVWNEARKSVNVQTGEEYLIPGHNKVTFTPDALVKDLINNPNGTTKTSEEKSGVIDPMERLNEQAEEIKGIISEIKDLYKSEDVSPIVSEGKVELSAPKEEEVIPVVESKPEPETVIAPPVEQVNVHKSHEKANPHESIQHAALSEKHNLNHREIPIKPKHNTRKIILFSLIAILIGGLVAFCVLNESLVTNYKDKVVSKISSVYTNLTSPQKEFKPKKVIIIPAKPKVQTDTVAQAKAIKKDTIKQSATPVRQDEKTLVKKTVIPVKPKVSVFEQARNYKEFLATETMEKGSRLVLLAEKYYGSKDFWVYIYEANRNVLKTPGSVSIGMKIKVPKLNPELIDLKNPECQKYAKGLDKKYNNK